MPETPSLTPAPIRPSEPRPARAPDAGATPAGALADALYALALRITGGAREAGDVVEQCLAEAGAGGPATGAGLAVMARRCRDLALVRSGKRPIGAVRRRRVAPAASARGDAPADLDALRREAALVLAGLDPEARRVIEMTAFEGFALADVAATLRSTPAIERARLRLGLAALASVGPPRLVIALAAPAASPEPGLRARLIAALERRA